MVATWCVFGLATAVPPRLRQQKRATNGRSNPPAPLPPLSTPTNDPPPQTPKQVDDGLSVETLPDGAGERIWVHIADVSRWVPEGSPLYEEARRRRTTIYLPEGAVPMFPPEVAHGVLSLR